MRNAIVIVILAACHANSNVDRSLPIDEAKLAHLDVKLASALVHEYHKQIERVAPPVSLAPTDGSELALRALTADITIEGPLAHTELHFTFHNDESRVREGRFAITLPPGAAVGRFAMKNGTEWREARIVSRKRGREIYESYLHKRADPALLEQDLANQFSARVFPIAANSDKEIIIGYDGRVSATEPYALALHGMPPIPELAISITRDGEPHAIHTHDTAPDDVIVRIAPGNDALAASDTFVARVDVAAGSARAPLDRVMILVDTSASRATIMGRQAAVVEQLLAAMPPITAVTVATFDQEVVEQYRGSARDAENVPDKLLAHGALGASDLGAALRRAADTHPTRLILIGDGSPTLGETAPAKLAAIIGTSAIERVDAIRVGQSVDQQTLHAITNSGRLPGAILDGGDVARTLHQLTTALARERTIRVDGAVASWPTTTRGTAPGEPVWVFAMFPDGAPVGKRAIHIGDQTIAITPRTGDHTRIRRAVAGAELATLTEQLQHVPPADQATLAAKIETIALEHQLVSQQTSLLVLESDVEERRMLGTPAPVATAVSVATPTTVGETIHVQASAPMIDPASTTQGITIDRDYLKNVPVPGRTFEAALGAAAGSQNDGLGVSYSGSSSLENQYYVDGINESGGEAIQISASAHEDPVSEMMAAGVDPTIVVDALTTRAVRQHRDPRPAETGPGDEPAAIAPYVGTMNDVMESIAGRRRDHALELAATWQVANPGDVAAIIALGEAFEARGSTTQAARAYGSIIDLYPNRAELLRAAGERLDRVPGARGLAIDAYRRSIRERPDQVSTYRLLAYDLMRENKLEALYVLSSGITKSRRDSISRILREDSSIIGGYLSARDPSRRAEIYASLGEPIPNKPSVRFVLSWETDANDVDLHVHDRNGAHAFYAHRDLASGGQLLDDITDGFGPEMFVVDSPDAFPYKLGVNYYSRGPEGVGLGSVQVIRYDGHGGVTIEDRPFLIQNDHAFVELGSAN